MNTPPWSFWRNAPANFMQFYHPAAILPSYCPPAAQPLFFYFGFPVYLRQPLPPHRLRHAGRKASRLSRISQPEHSGSKIENALVANRGFRFILGMNTTPLYIEQRTSCVMCIPRILKNARYPHHAWQGLHPVHPTKEGASPLCWILPAPGPEAAL